MSGLIGFHRTVEHVTVQVERETFALRNCDCRVPFKDRQIPGQGNDLPIPSPVDRFLQRAPGEYLRVRLDGGLRYKQ